MKTFVRILLGVIAALVLLGIGINVWMKGLAKDDGGANRPKYGAFTWEQPAVAPKPADGKQVDDEPRAQSLPNTPRGGPVPRADGSLSEILCVRHTIPPKEFHAPQDNQARYQRQIGTAANFSQAT